jgi:hypothetical protein
MPQRRRGRRCTLGRLGTLATLALTSASGTPGCTSGGDRAGELSEADASSDDGGPRPDVDAGDRSFDGALDVGEDRTFVPAEGGPEAAPPDGPLDVAEDGPPADYRIETWRTLEISLTSGTKYAYPFDDVDVTATFVGPDGTVLKRPAYYDGASTWRVRFAPTKVGRWTMTTVATDDTNGALHGVVARIDAVSYAGTIAVFQHGFPRVSDNHHAFSYADGKPFFYLGDTHWLVMHERWDTCNYAGCSSQFKYEVDHRIAQGFTVYQTEWMASQGANGAGLPQESFYGAMLRCKLADSDLDGMRNADRKLGYLADSGLVVAAAIEWRALAPACSDAFLKQYARYWVARFGSYPLLWTVAQEVDGQYGGDPQNLDSKWQVVGKALADNDSYAHPLTAHMCSGMPDTSGSSWKGLGYHQWFAAQLQGDVPSIATMSSYYASGKVAVFYEPPYENFWTDRTGERIRAYVAYQSGLAGFGYGVAGVWDDNYQCAPSRDSGTDYDGNCRPWYDGLFRDSAEDMSRLAKFYSALDWQRLAPGFDATWADFSSREQTRLASDEWKKTVVYFYNADTGSGILKRLNPNTTYTARWYDPRQGTFSAIGTNAQPDANCRWTIPAKPSGQDWILIVEANQPTAAAAACTAASAIGIWSMDGNTADSSGNGNAGTLVNGSYVAGHSNSAISLNGSNSYATILDASVLHGLSNMTIAVWARLDALPSQNDALVNKEGAYRLAVAPDGTWHAEMATTNNGWYAAGTTAGCSSKLATATWYHLAATYDGASIRVYLNGMLCGTSSPTISGPLVDNANPIDLGRGSGGNVGYMAGQLDELRIYATALSAAEVQALAQ